MLYLVMAVATHRLKVAHLQPLAPVRPYFHLVMY
nr:MAG TPA: hypothetical protein [Caudoviricetes sp.]DAY21550.1 MAG TPA: hypothetical protein [Caudoviricetes sp.]